MSQYEELRLKSARGHSLGADTACNLMNSGVLERVQGPAASHGAEPIMLSPVGVHLLHQSHEHAEDLLLPGPAKVGNHPSSLLPKTRSVLPKATKFVECAEVM